jgi:hypothetical protein
MGDLKGCGSAIDRAECACAPPDDTNCHVDRLIHRFAVVFLLSITWSPHQPGGCRTLIPIHLSVAVIRKLYHEYFALLGCYAAYVGSFSWTAWPM